MNVWTELLLNYILNAYWLGALAALSAWLIARWLRGAGAAVVCWVWRIAIFAAALLPLVSTGLVVGGQGDVQVADGSSSRAQWVLFLLVVFCGLHILWRYGSLVADWRTAQRLRMSAVPAHLPLWAWQVHAECTGRFHGRPETVLAGKGDAAYTAGWRRPLLVLPERYLDTVEVPGLASIIGHELAHIERCDYAWNLVLEAVSALVSFHPAMAWMKANADLERERACDELVVRRLRPAVEYAEDLLGFARFCLRSPAPRQAITALNGNTLEARVRSLLSPARGVSMRAAIGRASVAAVAVIAMSAALPWRALYVDFAPRPSSVPLPAVLYRTNGRASWTPAPPPPPPAPAIHRMRMPPPPPPPPPADFL